MKNNKIFVLLPDGIGLRNFAFSKFYELGLEKGFDVIFWNNTPFDISSLGFKEVKILNSKINSKTDLYKNGRKHIELNLNVLKSSDKVYDTYKFPFSFKTWKNAAKSLITQYLIFVNCSEKRLIKVKLKIKKLERDTNFYKESYNTLKVEKPAFIFCTNQRSSSAIAPILAAKDLGIPTATFIFSWDNLPKATMVVETNFYFVWSDFMKKELLYYYPYIKEEEIFVTGTPQFEMYFNASKQESRKVFFTENGLDLNKKYICYSGDDVTTCPDDAKYLEDLAIAVQGLNNTGCKLGIVFRRCPVDFSDRFDSVLETFKNIIVPISPKWERKGQMWNTILPTKEDNILLTNTIAHTEMVINLGSSMVFDYALHHKPCFFINYDVKNKVLKNWSVKKIYNYIHFRSMPSKNAVIWLNNSNEIAIKIEKALINSTDVVENAKNWFRIINRPIPELASFRIWDEIKNILK